MKSAALGAVKGVIGQEEIERRGLSAEEIKAREDSVRSGFNNDTSKFQIDFKVVFLSTWV